MEVLDSEPSIVRTEHYGDAGEYKDAKEHFLDDGSSFVTFSRGGYTEIHHATESGLSGHKTSTVAPMNLKWVNNAFHIIKPLVDSGQRVKLMGTTHVEDGHKTSLFHNYSRMAVLVAKKHGYHVTKPEFGFNDEGKPVGHIIITQRTHGFMGEVQKNMVESMNEENNFRGLTVSQAIQKTLGVI
jgi:hypothetical protein